MTSGEQLICKDGMRLKFKTHCGKILVEKMCLRQNNSQLYIYAS